MKTLKKFANAVCEKNLFLHNHTQMPESEHDEAKKATLAVSQEVKEQLHFCTGHAKLPLSEASWQ